MEHNYLYIALATALLVIAGLACAVIHYRRRLYHCQQAMVRCINENLDMKAKLPPGEQPHFFTSQEVSPKEFTKIICNMLKRLMYVSVFFLLAICPTMAQEKTDTAYVFRFVVNEDMFYVPYAGNDTELARLERCIALCHQRILDGEIPLYVEGHADKYAIAKNRSNRVKSELIIRQGLKERCFVTRNHADGENYVIVTIKAPSDIYNGEPKDSPRTDVEKESTEPPIYNKEETTGNDVAQDAITETQIKETVTQPTVSAEATVAVSDKEYALSLRFNLLRWATLTPDLGLEWRISRSWGIQVNGSWTSWSWNNKDRRYALWEVSPEVRYYMGKERRGYLGAMYKAGAFNYKLSATGKQGDLIGGGITGGYQLRLNKALSMDFNVGIGCLHADYDKYEVVDGVRVRGGKESKNWWGPINAGVTLVWKIK